MLEAFRGEVAVNKDQQDKRNKLMRERLKTQFKVMEKLGFALDNEGFLNWGRSDNASKFEKIFESKVEGTAEINPDELVDVIADEISKEPVH